ncbi:DUF6505 family protein [Bradyrhizobium genosp. P]|uniref:DUF6505 family protein n=1 Tax=Bradyrhizobium genosp. P TaxID=83641 RepID=UPI003CF1E975
MKLLRTIQFDLSDTFVFECAALPGEWAVSGAFAFLNENIPALQGKARTAFRAGFLGLRSLGRSTLVQIVDADEQDRVTAVEILAEQLVSRFDAPDVAMARAAAEEEIGFTASLCDHPVGVVIAVTRTLDGGSIRETFRTLRPAAQVPSRAFSFVELVGEDGSPNEQLNLADLGKAARI